MCALCKNYRITALENFPLKVSSIKIWLQVSKQLAMRQNRKVKL